jgi:hypothetical protein
LLANLVGGDPINRPMPLYGHDLFPVCLDRVFSSLAQEPETVPFQVADQVAALD